VNPKLGFHAQKRAGLQQAPQDLNPSSAGRSDLVHADEDARVLGWINRDHIAES